MNKVMHLSTLAVTSALVLSAGHVANAQQIPQSPNMTFFVTSTIDSTCRPRMPRFRSAREYSPWPIRWTQ